MPSSRREFLRSGSVGLSALTLGAWRRTPLRAARKKVRMGVVGGGFGCSFHWHQDPDCEVVAVSDLREDRQKLLRETYGCDTVYPSLEVLLGDDRVDAVALFTEAPNHVRHAVQCMQAGKHVFSAVPAAVTLEECETLVATRARTGRTYMMAETSWYRSHTIVARELFQKGAFGRMTYSEAEYYHPAICHAAHELSHHDGERTWRYGYPPLLYPTHTTSFLVGVTGEHLTQVSAQGWGCEDEALKDNPYQNRFCNGAAMFRTSGGFPFRGNVFWHLDAHGERAQWIGEDAAFYMPGSGDRPFRFDSKDHGSLTTLPDTFARLPEAMRIDSGHGGSHPHLTHEFVQALAEERTPAIDLERSLAITVPGIVAHASALAGGTLLEIPHHVTGERTS